MDSSPHDFSHPDSVKNARSVILKFALVKEIFAGSLIEDISRRLLPEFVRLCRGDYSEVLYDVALYLETRDIKHIELHCWHYDSVKIMRLHVDKDIINTYGADNSHMCNTCDKFIRTGKKDYECWCENYSFTKNKNIPARLRIARHPVVISRLTRLLEDVNS